MGAAKLARTVVVNHPETGEQFTFGPDTEEVPAWAQKAIVNPAAWEGRQVPGGEDDEAVTADSEYDEKTKNDVLEAIIAARNEGRDDDAKIAPEGTTKAQLFEALKKDDAASA